jgi:uncharacterized protein
MKVLAQKLISTGADLSTRKTLKNTLNYLGIKPENIDNLYIELKNSMHRDKFVRTPPEKKAVFIPQCMRNSKTCKAVLGEFGWECAKCSGYKECKVFAIKEKAEKAGYKVFIVPGGSMVFKILKEIKPSAVLGIACMKELIMAAEEISLPIQAVRLSKDGCVDTDVDLKEVFTALDGS